MKGMILAAGRGQRMMPLTEHMPKPMLQVGGKPLIQYHIERLREAGITDIVINLAWQGEVIKNYFGSGETLGVSITYSEEEEGGLETAGGIINALPLLENEEDCFIVINGDIFTDYCLSGLKALHLEQGEGHLVLVENPEHNPTGDFSLAHQAMSESKYTFSGISKFHKSFFNAQTSSFKRLAPLLTEGLEESRLSTELYIGTWFDIGTPQRLEEMNQIMEQNSVG